MSWVRIDDRAPHHRKQLAAGPAACWLWVCGLAYCNGQPDRSGVIPEHALGVLYPMPNAKREAARLVDVGLWEPIDGGWRVHDYHEFQPSQEADEERRRKRSEAGKYGGIRSGESRRAKQVASFASKQTRSNTEASCFDSVEANGKQTIEANANPVPSRPDLSPCGSLSGPDRSSRAGGASPPPGGGTHTHEPDQDGGDSAVSALLVGRDLYPQDRVPLRELVQVSQRLRRAIDLEPAAKRARLTPEIAIGEAVSATRTWRKKHPEATPEACLARVEEHVVRFVLGDCRLGKRTPLPIEQAAGDGLVPRHGHRLF